VSPVATKGAGGGNGQHSPAALPQSETAGCLVVARPAALIRLAVPFGLAYTRGCYGRRLRGEEMDLKPLIRTVPDFPKPGILFRDITPLLKDATAYSYVLSALADRYPAGRARRRGRH
jgi:hypothetical protein